MQIKVVLLGNSGVGKTSLLKYLKSSKFESVQFSIGAAYTVQKINILTETKTPPDVSSQIKQLLDEKSKLQSQNTPDTSPVQEVSARKLRKTPNVKQFFDQAVLLQIWDTCGQERFKSLAFNYCRNCNAILLVYDVSSLQSLKDCQLWINMINSECPGAQRLVMLVGNKADDANLITQQQRDEQQQFCSKNSIQHSVFTSAKTGLNVKSSFEQLATACFENCFAQNNCKEKIEIVDVKKRKLCCE